MVAVSNPCHSMGRARRVQWGESEEPDERGPPSPRLQRTKLAGRSPLASPANFGAPRPKVVEHQSREAVVHITPLTTVREVRVQWWRPEVNLAELAKLRWVSGWSVKQLSEHFDRSPITVGQYLRKLRRGKIFQLPFEPHLAERIQDAALEEDQRIEAELISQGRRVR